MRGKGSGDDDAVEGALALQAVAAIGLADDDIADATAVSMPLLRLPVTSVL